MVILVSPCSTSNGLNMPYTIPSYIFSSSPPKTEPDEQKKPAPRPKPKPTPPKPPPPKEIVKPDDKKDFTSLLKSLSLDEPKEEEQTAQIATLSDKMSRSWEAKLNRAISPCWRVNAGAKYAENLTVEITVYANRDGTVRDVKINDMISYASNRNFAAAADAASRAVRNSACWPLPLPPEKYDLWKVFTYRFDPSAML